MLKRPNLHGKFICGPCNDSEASYTVREHIISYRLPRRECITINGLAAFCEKCGKYARIAAIEDYNADLAEDAYSHPDLIATIDINSVDSNSDNQNAIPEEDSVAKLSLVTNEPEFDGFTDIYSEDPSGQMEFTDLFTNAS